MTETKPHQFEKTFTYEAGADKHFTAYKVRVGEVLKITHIMAGHNDLSDTQYAELGYWNGHAYKPLHYGKPPISGGADHGGMVHWNGEVWLREGQYIYAYFPDIAGEETVQLQAEGKFE